MTTIVLMFLTAWGTAFAKPTMARPPLRNIPAGTVVIKESERALYFVLGTDRAIRYPVAVPKAGMRWSGRTVIVGKHRRPAWAPPAVVRRDHPELPDYIPGGAPDNPMGEAALLLALDEIAIHGTSRSMRASIGTSASYGCIRMYNEDVLDLYARVHRGTVVVLVK